MGQRYELAGAKFVNPAYKKIFDDQGLHEGSMVMLDFTHSLTKFTGVPVEGSTVYNLAWKQLRDMLGAGDATSLAIPFTSTLTQPAGAFEYMAERTAKGALHFLISQVNQLSTHRATFRMPPTARPFLRANPTDAICVHLWAHCTRAPTNGNQRTVIIANNAGVLSNNLINSNLVGAVGPLRASVNRPTGWVGTVAPSDAALIDNILAFGNADGYSSLTNNTAASYVVDRLHVSNLRVLNAKRAAGYTAVGLPPPADLTFADIDAADQALYSATFGAGGRLNGDSWSLTPASLP